MQISPRGLVSLITFIHEGIFYNHRPLLLRIFKDNYAKSLCALIKDSQLSTLQEWPNFAGGGVSAINLVTAQILRIFNLPYAQQVYIYIYIYGYSHTRRT